MKRFMTIAALTSALATGALAATEEQATLINTYAPDVDVSMLSDQQVIEAMGIANGGDSDTHKREKIETIAMKAEGPTTFSKEQISSIEVYLPAKTVMMLTGEQRGEALAIIAAKKTDVETRAQLAVIGENLTPALTPGELSEVKTIAPDADLTVLTTDQVAQIRAVIYSDENDAQRKSRIEEVVS